MHIPKAVTAAAAAAAPRFVMYYDEWHPADTVPADVSGGITHVVTAFAKSTLTSIPRRGKNSVGGRFERMKLGEK